MEVATGAQLAAAVGAAVDPASALVAVTADISDGEPHDSHEHVFGGAVTAMDQAPTLVRPHSGVCIGASSGACSSGVRVPTARKEEVQRLMGQALVVRCDPSSSYLAPVVIMAAEESNLYQLVEKHFRPEFMVGPEKFWRLVRAELGLDTWRPRVQGTQLKALVGVRLPETEDELHAVEAVVRSLEDCLADDSSPDAFMSELRITLGQIQAWWENRNRRQDAALKRAAQQQLMAMVSAKRPYLGTGSFPLLHGGSDQLLSFMQLGASAGGSAFPDGGGDDTAAAAAAAATAAGLSVDGACVAPHAVLPGGHLPVTAGDDGATTMAAAAAAAAAAAMGAPLLQQTHAHARLHQAHTQMPPPMQPLGSAAAAQCSTASLADLAASPEAACEPLLLDVGGVQYRAMLSTLLAAPGSLFWGLLRGTARTHLVRLTPGGTLFIDRAGPPFAHVLEYLRAIAARELMLPAPPSDPSELTALVREAAFYQLPGLLQHIADTGLAPPRDVRVTYNSLYIETGFKAMEGEGLADMERSKVLLVQQLNHMVKHAAARGYHAQDVTAGVTHREPQQPAHPPSSGGSSHQQLLDKGQSTQQQQQQQPHEANIYYNVLLKRSVPLVPPELLAAAAAGGGLAPDGDQDGGIDGGDDADEGGSREQDGQSSSSSEEPDPAYDGGGPPDPDSRQELGAAQGVLPMQQG